MATTSTNSHSGKHRSDHEIEKYRLELNWTKILDKLKSAKVSGEKNLFLTDQSNRLFLSRKKKNMENFSKVKLN